MMIGPHVHPMRLGEVQQGPPILVTGERPKSSSDLGTYLAFGGLAVLLVGVGALVYQRRRR